MAKLFFATRDDLLPRLAVAEARSPVQYVRSGFHPTPEIKTYRSALEIPGFGESEYGDFHVQPYLLLPVNVINTRPVPQSAGGILYDVGPRNNAEGFWYRFGGWYQTETDRFLVGSELARYSNAQEVRGLYNRYIRALTKGFEIIRDQYNQPWWVGPEAMGALKSGVRLVTNEAQLPLHLQTYLSLNGYAHLAARSAL